MFLHSQESGLLPDFVGPVNSKKMSYYEWRQSTARPSVEAKAIHSSTENPTSEENLNLRGNDSFVSSGSKLNPEQQRKSPSNQLFPEASGTGSFDLNQTVHEKIETPAAPTINFKGMLISWAHRHWPHEPANTIFLYDTTVSNRGMFSSCALLRLSKLTDFSSLVRQPEQFSVFLSEDCLLLSLQKPARQTFRKKVAAEQAAARELFALLL